MPTTNTINRLKRQGSLDSWTRTANTGNNMPNNAEKSSSIGKTKMVDSKHGKKQGPSKSNVKGKTAPLQLNKTPVNLTTEDIQGMEPEEIENLINSVPTTLSNRLQLLGTVGQITGQNQTATDNHSPSLDQNGKQMPTSESKFDNKLLNIMNELWSTMDILKWDMDDIKSAKQDIQDLTQVASTQEETIKHIQMAKHNLKSEVDMLRKLVAHQDHIIQNLQGKLVDQQKRSM